MSKLSSSTAFKRQLIGIFVTVVGLFLPLGAGAAGLCYQPQLVSLYPTDKPELKYQEFVGTTIRWVPNNRNYILTVAHGVVNSTQVMGVCDGQVFPLKVVGIDTDRDVALLEVPANSEIVFQPFFMLPQGDHMQAVARVTSRLNKPNDFVTREADLPPPRLGNYLRAAYGDDSKSIDIYKHLAIMHPFFKNSELADQKIEVAVFRWKPAIRKDVGIFEFQETAIVDQFLLNEHVTKGLQNPFYSFKPHYISVGVRPGMSGAPVFEYLDTNLATYNNLLTGLVSKTRSFKKMSLLIPSVIVEEAIDGILKNRPVASEHMSYTYIPNLGKQFPYFTSKKLNLSFRNACDSDFANTSDLVTSQEKSPLEAVQAYARKDKLRTMKESRGGDWADGGGNEQDADHYIYSPFFTDSRHIPSLACEEAGVTDNNGKHSVAYRVRDKIYPLRNLDQLPNYIKAVEKSGKEVKLIQATQLSTVKKDICSQYVLKQNGFWPHWMRQISEQTIRQKSDGISLPTGVIYSAPRLQGHISQFACDEQGRISLDLQSSSIGKEIDPFFTVKIKDQGDYSELKMKLGRCYFSARGKNFGFEMNFKHELAEVKFLYEEPGTWIINIGQISDTCGFNTTKKSAIRVDIDVKRVENEMSRELLYGSGI